MSKIFGKKKVKKEEVKEVPVASTVEQDTLTKQLCEYCFEGQEDEARQFLQNQMAQPKGIDLIVINGIDYHGKTPLHNACSNGHSKIALWLLAIPGIDVNRPTFEKVTPLHTAMQNRQGECTALLIIKGADPTFKNLDGKTPLELAVGRTEGMYDKWLSGFKKLDAFSKEYPIVLKTTESLETVIDPNMKIESKANAVVSPRQEIVFTAPKVQREEYVVQVSPRKPEPEQPKKKMFAVVDGEIVKVDSKPLNTSTASGQTLNNSTNNAQIEGEEPEVVPEKSMEQQLLEMRKQAQAKSQARKKNLLDSSSEEEKEVAKPEPKAEQHAEGEKKEHKHKSHKSSDGKHKKEGGGEKKEHKSSHSKKSSDAGEKKEGEKKESSSGHHTKKRSGSEAKKVKETQ